MSELRAVKKDLAAIKNAKGNSSTTTTGFGSEGSVLGGKRERSPVGDSENFAYTNPNQPLCDTHNESDAEGATSTCAAEPDSPSENGDDPFHAATQSLSKEQLAQADDLPH